MDKICYFENNCLSEEKGSAYTVNLFTLNQCETMDYISLEDKLFFLIKGKITLSSTNHVDSIISENSFAYLPVEQYYSLEALETSILLIIKVRGHISFSSCLDIEDLARYYEYENYTWTNELYLLEMNREIKLYIDFIQICLNNKISCGIFYENKVKELLFLMYFSYTKKELSLFFHDALSVDSKFHFDIMRNSRKCKSVIELAQSLNYSVSGFEKHFKRIFGISPYKWMLQNRAQMVYDEIRLKKKTFKEICSEYNFSSIPHFTNFCKIFLGATPSHIRKYGKATMSKPNKAQVS